MFRDINGNPADVQIQDLQMDSSVSTVGGAKFMLLDSSDKRAAQVTYHWVPASEFTKYGITGFDGKNGVWAKQGGTDPRHPTYTVPTGDAAILKAGTGIQLNINGEGKALNLSGEVSDAQIVLTTVNNFNFIGYPFPTDGDIRDIQMDDTVSTVGGAKFMLLDNSDKRAAQVTYHLVPRDQFTKYGITGRDGDFGTWAKQGGTDPRHPTYTEPTGDALILKAGSAIQLNINGNGKKVYINPPYTLAK